jgi:hypothetical protein
VSVPTIAVVFVASFAATLLLGLAPRLLRRSRARAGRPSAVGETAAPDAVHLALAPDDAWHQDAQAQRVALALEREGFVPAGTFTMVDRPGLVVQLLVHEQEGLLGAVYEHGERGHWLEVVRRGLGSRGTTTWTTAKPFGRVPERAGEPWIHLVDAPVDDVMRRVRAEARLRPARTARRDEARAWFEEREGELRAWLRRVGGSR